MANVYIIVCTNKETDAYEELSGSYVYRGLAEAAKNNLSLNFPQFNFDIKVLELKGVVQSLSNNSLFCFHKEGN